MLAELVDHVIGIDPDRDRVTAAIVASNTTAVIATEEFSATASGYRDLVRWADAHSVARESGVVHRRHPQLRGRRDLDARRSR